MSVFATKPTVHPQDLIGLGITTVGEPAEREATEVDFGRLVRGDAAAVVAPRSADELAEIVALANQRGFKLTAWSRGRSQGGQALPNGGIAVDFSRLDSVDSPNVASRTIRCEPGATWRDVLTAAGPCGLVPEVMPMNLDLTVGGLLSIGGLGATSHLYGPAIAEVEALEVITGGGRRLECSAEQEPEVFEAVLAGLGRVAFITAATLRLRPARPFVRTFHLLYDRPDRWLTDQRALVRAGAPYMESFCSPCIQGFRGSASARRLFAEWFYTLQVSFEHDGSPPEAEHVLDGLAPFRVVHQEDAPTAAFADRYAPRFAWMRRSGALTHAHPWVEALLPGENVLGVLPRLLGELPLALGENPRVFFLAKPRSSRFFMTPPSAEVIGVALTPGSVLPHLEADALAAMRAAHVALSEAGGRRYVSGWLEMMDGPAWRAHFGEQFAAWVGIKRELDPRGVLTSRLLDQISASTGSAST